MEDPEELSPVYSSESVVEMLPPLPRYEEAFTSTVIPSGSKPHNLHKHAGPWYSTCDVINQFANLISVGIGCIYKGPHNSGTT